jgi:hypothetical protein
MPAIIPLEPQKDKPDERYPIVIRRDGAWLYHGSVITRIGLVKLFASALRRDALGDYWLITPVERGRITVEDSPFVVVELQMGDILRFRTNLDEWVSLDAAHPLTMRNRVPYIQVRDGLEARLATSVYYQLAELACDIKGQMGVLSGGLFFVLEEHDAA